FSLHSCPTLLPLLFPYTTLFRSRLRCASSPSVISSEREIILWFAGWLFRGRGAVDFVDGVADFGAVAFPTVKYLRIISSDFPPSPHIASKSSTLLNPPYDFRSCKIFFRRCWPDSRHSLQFFRCRRI